MNYKKEYKRQDNEKQEEPRFDDQVEGRNSVLELLESGKDINKIFITSGEKHGSINKIIAMAKEKRIIIVEKDKRQMQEMAQTQNYQGVIAIVPPFEYCQIEDIINKYFEEMSYEQDFFYFDYDKKENKYYLDYYSDGKIERIEIPEQEIEESKLEKGWFYAWYDNEQIVEANSIKEGIKK